MDYSPCDHWEAGLDLDSWGCFYWASVPFPWRPKSKNRPARIQKPASCRRESLNNPVIDMSTCRRLVPALGEPGQVSFQCLDRNSKHRKPDTNRLSPLLSWSKMVSVDFLLRNHFEVTTRYRSGGQKINLFRKIDKRRKEGKNLGYVMSVFLFFFLFFINFLFINPGFAIQTFISNIRRKRKRKNQAHTGHRWFFDSLSFCSSFLMFEKVWGEA